MKIRVYALLVLFFFLLNSQTLHASYPDEEQEDRFIQQLYHTLSQKPKASLSQRIQWFSQQFIGKPYLLGALGEGPLGDYDQYPLHRMDAFDCETFVDTVLALSLANHPHQFKQCIRAIRYTKGKVSFITRNHFTDLDWNKNLQSLGILMDITSEIVDNHHQPIAKMAKAVINKPSWYQHLSPNAIRIEGLSPSQKMSALKELQQKASQLPVLESSIPYLPLSRLFDAQGKPVHRLFKQIPQGSIIEIIRPNWDLTNQIGTCLNVSHLGFAIWKNHTLYFREASSIEHQVIDVPLEHYLKEASKSPTIQGINIQKLIPKTAKPELCLP